MSSSDQPLTYREYAVAAKAAAQWMFYVDDRKEARLAAEEQKRLAAEEQKRLAVEEQKRLAVEEQKRLAVEEQKRLAAEEQKRLAAEEQKRLDFEKEKRLLQKKVESSVETTVLHRTEVERTKTTSTSYSNAGSAAGRSSGTLTYHQIAVASKAAYRWLEFVDQKIMEREAAAAATAKLNSLQNKSETSSANVSFSSSKDDSFNDSKSSIKKQVTFEAKTPKKAKKPQKPSSSKTSVADDDKPTGASSKDDKKPKHEVAMPDLYSKADFGVSRTVSQQSTTTTWHRTVTSYSSQQQTTIRETRLGSTVASKWVSKVIESGDQSSEVPESHTYKIREGRRVELDTKDEDSGEGFNVEIDDDEPLKTELNVGQIEVGSKAAASWIGNILSHETPANTPTDAQENTVTPKIHISKPGVPVDEEALYSERRYFEESIDDSKEVDFIADYSVHVKPKFTWQRMFDYNLPKDEPRKDHIARIVDGPLEKSVAPSSVEIEQDEDPLVLESRSVHDIALVDSPSVPKPTAKSQETGSTSHLFKSSPEFLPEQVNKDKKVSFTQEVEVTNCNEPSEHAQNLFDKPASTNEPFERKNREETQPDTSVRELKLGSKVASKWITKVIESGEQQNPTSATDDVIRPVKEPEDRGLGTDLSVPQNKVESKAAASRIGNIPFNGPTIETSTNVPVNSVNRGKPATSDVPVDEEEAYSEKRHYVESMVDGDEDKYLNDTTMNYKPKLFDPNRMFDYTDQDVSVANVDGRLSNSSHPESRRHEVPRPMPEEVEQEEDLLVAEKRQKPRRSKRRSKTGSGRATAGNYVTTRTEQTESSYSELTVRTQDVSSRSQRFRLPKVVDVDENSKNDASGTNMSNASNEASKTDANLAAAGDNERDDAGSEQSESGRQLKKVPQLTRMKNFNIALAFAKASKRKRRSNLSTTSSFDTLSGFSIGSSEFDQSQSDMLSREGDQFLGGVPEEERPSRLINVGSISASKRITSWLSNPQKDLIEEDESHLAKNEHSRNSELKSVYDGRERVEPVAVVEDPNNDASLQSAPSSYLPEEKPDTGPLRTSNLVEPDAAVEESPVDSRQRDANRSDELTLTPKVSDHKNETVDETGQPNPESDSTKPLADDDGAIPVRDLRFGSLAAGKWIDKLLAKDEPTQNSEGVEPVDVVEDPNNDASLQSAPSSYLPEEKPDTGPLRTSNLVDTDAAVEDSPVDSRQRDANRSDEFPLTPKVSDHKNATVNKTGQPKPGSDLTKQSLEEGDNLPVGDIRFGPLAPYNWIDNTVAEDEFSQNAEGVVPVLVEEDPNNDASLQSSPSIFQPDEKRDSGSLPKSYLLDSQADVEEPEIDNRKRKPTNNEPLPIGTKVPEPLESGYERNSENKNEFEVSEFPKERLIPKMKNAKVVLAFSALANKKPVFSKKKKKKSLDSLSGLSEQSDEYKPQMGGELKKDAESEEPLDGDIYSAELRSDPKDVEENRDDVSMNETEAEGDMHKVVDPVTDVLLRDPNRPENLANLTVDEDSSDSEMVKPEAVDHDYIHAAVLQTNPTELSLEKNAGDIRWPVVEVEETETDLVVRKPSGIKEELLEPTKNDMGPVEPEKPPEDELFETEASLGSDDLGDKENIDSAPLKGNEALTPEKADANPWLATEVCESDVLQTEPKNDGVLTDQSGIEEEKIKGGELDDDDKRETEREENENVGSDDERNPEDKGEDANAEFPSERLIPKMKDAKVVLAFSSLASKKPVFQKRKKNTETESAYFPESVIDIPSDSESTGMKDEDGSKSHSLDDLSNSEVHLDIEEGTDVRIPVGVSDDSPPVLDPNKASFESESSDFAFNPRKGKHVTLDIDDDSGSDVSKGEGKPLMRMNGDSDPDSSKKGEGVVIDMSDEEVGVFHQGKSLNSEFPESDRSRTSTQLSEEPIAAVRVDQDSKLQSVIPENFMLEQDMPGASKRSDTLPFNASSPNNFKTPVFGFPNDTIDTTYFNSTLSSSFCPPAESTMTMDPSADAGAKNSLDISSDYEVEIFCYSTTGPTSMIDLMTLEILCYCLAVNLQPIVHSVHSYETLCQENFPKYVIKSKKNKNAETTFFTSHEVMMFLNSTAGAAEQLAQAPQKEREAYEKAFKCVEKVRLGVVYSLFFHKNNFSTVVIPFFMKVLPYLSAISKPKLVQDFWTSFIKVSGQNIDNEDAIMFSALTSAEQLIALLDPAVTYPHKNSIRNLFFANIVQLNLVEFRDHANPFQELLAQNQQLCSIAHAMFRKLQSVLPKANWNCDHYLRRIDRPPSALSLFTSMESLHRGSVVSVFSCPGPDGLPSWDPSCLKTIVILRGLGFPVNVHSCQESPSNRIWTDQTVYELDETSFDSEADLMRYLRFNFKISLPKSKQRFDEQKLMSQIFGKLRLTLEQTLWQTKENLDHSVANWKELHAACGRETKNRPLGAPASAFSESKMRIELDSALGFVSGILSDKLFLRGTSQPTEADAELFSLLTIPLMNEFPYNPLYEALASYPNLYYFLADILRNYLNVEPKRTFQDCRMARISLMVSPLDATNDISHTDSDSSALVPSDASSGSLSVTIHCIGSPVYLPSLNLDCLYAAIYLGMNDVPCKFVVKHCYCDFWFRSYPAYTVRRFGDVKPLVFYDVDRLLLHLDRSRCLKREKDSRKTLIEAFIRSSTSFLEPAVLLHFWKVFQLRFETVFANQSHQCCLGSIRFHREKSKIVPKVLKDVQKRYRTQGDNDSIQMVFGSAEAYLKDICTLLGNQSYLCGKSYSKLDAKIASLLILPLLCNVGTSSITRVIQTCPNLQTYLFKVYRGFLRHHLLHLIHTNNEIVLSTNLNILEIPHFERESSKLQSLSGHSTTRSQGSLSSPFADAEYVVIFTPSTCKPGLPTLDHECIQLAVMLRSQNITVHFESRASKLCLHSELPSIQVRHSDGRLTTVTREEIDNYLDSIDHDVIRTAEQFEQKHHLMTDCESKLLPAVLYTLWAVSENFESLTFPWFASKCFESNLVHCAIRKRDEMIMWIHEDARDAVITELANQSSNQLITSAVTYLKELSELLKDNSFLLSESVTSLDAQVFSLLYILIEIDVPSNPLADYIERDTSLHRFVYQLRTRAFEPVADLYSSVSSRRSAFLVDTINESSPDEIVNIDAQPLLYRSARMNSPLLRKPVIIQCFGYRSRVPTLDTESLQLAASLAFVHVPVQFKTTTRGFSLYLMCRPPPIRKFSLETPDDFYEGNDDSSFLNEVSQVYRVHPDSWLSPTLKQDMRRLREYIVDAIVPFVEEQLWVAHFNSVTKRWIKDNLPLFVSNSFAERQKQMHMHRLETEASEENLMKKYISCCQKLSWLLNENEFLLGSRPCTLDALVFSQLSVLRELKPSLYLETMEPARNNLIKYLDRISARYVLLNPGWKSYSCGMYWSLALIAIVAGVCAYSALVAMGNLHVWEPTLFGEDLDK